MCRVRGLVTTLLPTSSCNTVTVYAQAEAAPCQVGLEYQQSPPDKLNRMDAAASAVTVLNISNCLSHIMQESQLPLSNPSASL